jgi:CRP/FNR family transcriptional regulator
MADQKILFSSLLNDAVYQTGQIKQFSAGAVIVNLQSYIKTIPIVLSGSIKVLQADEEGQEIFLYYIKPGESCIMSLLAGMHNSKSKIKAIVEEDAELLLIPINKVGEWIRTFPEWTDFIFTLYQKRFEELLEVVNAVSFQKMDTRLFHLLNQKSSLFHTREIKITHLQLAEELGTTREAVSRVLKQMEKDHLIILSRNKISLM